MGEHKRYHDCYCHRQAEFVKKIENNISFMSKQNFRHWGIIVKIKDNNIENQKAGRILLKMSRVPS